MEEKAQPRGFHTPRSPFVGRLTAAPPQEPLSTRPLPRLVARPQRGARAALGPRLRQRMVSPSLCAAPHITGPLQLAAHTCKFPCYACPSLWPSQLRQSLTAPTNQKWALPPDSRSLSPVQRAFGGREFLAHSFLFQVRLPVFLWVAARAPVYISRLTLDHGQGLMMFASGSWAQPVQGAHVYPPPCKIWTSLQRPLPCLLNTIQRSGKSLGLELQLGTPSLAPGQCIFLTLPLEPQLIYWLPRRGREPSIPCCFSPPGL